ncbi:unnamed protein product [Rhizophagus irregularis]|nr:unnamed protein product [Rhizophagus irregularis]CAB4430942.1 unnamed protein product [Rhizophagus irregularis]
MNTVRIFSDVTGSSQTWWLCHEPDTHALLGYSDIDFFGCPDITSIQNDLLKTLNKCNFDYSAKFTYFLFMIFVAPQSGSYATSRRAEAGTQKMNTPSSKNIKLRWCKELSIGFITPAGAV